MEKMFTQALAIFKFTLLPFGIVGQLQPVTSIRNCLEKMILQLQTHFGIRSSTKLITTFSTAVFPRCATLDDVHSKHRIEGQRVMR